MDQNNQNQMIQNQNRQQQMEQNCQKQMQHQHQYLNNSELISIDYAFGRNKLPEFSNYIVLISVMYMHPVHQPTPRDIIL